MATYKKTPVSGVKYRYAIFVSRFNETITERLLEGAVDCLNEFGISDDQFDIFSCPGAFEIPVLAKRVLASGRYQAAIALGAVIRGETAHFEYVSGHAANGIGQVAMETGIPIAFGILTTENADQALNRAGLKQGNKGYEAALTALEMAGLLESVPRTA